MLGSAYKVENVIWIFSLLCFSSVANMLEDGMGVQVHGMCGSF